MLAHGPMVEHATMPSRPARPGNGLSHASLRRGREVAVPEDSAAKFRDLRAGDQDASEGRLLLATFRVRIPKELWTAKFSSRHPTTVVEALNRAGVNDDVSVSDYWIAGQPPGVWTREIADNPDVMKVDCLAGVGDGSIYRITFRNPPIVYLYRKLAMPIQFPLRIQGGFIRWEVVARRLEFQAIMDHMRKTDPEFQVISIRRRPLRSHLPLLTSTQHELLTQAMAAGYFAVPRGITLTNLAKRLGRSKSSVSETIAVIEKKLLETALRPSPFVP